MDEIHFFEYAIQLKKCEFVKYECIGIKIRDGVYRTKFYKNKKYTGNERIIYLSEFEVIQSYRIISFKNDSKYYNDYEVTGFRFSTEFSESDITVEIKKK